jgi:cell division initiation protein
MRLTPLDIQNHRFQRRFGGYDRDEVEAFLRLVAEDTESLVRENQNLVSRLKQVEARLDELQGTERLLRDAVVTAQSMSEDLRQTALKESEVVLGEAEIRAEKILDAAHRRGAEIAEDIREMKLLRTRLAAAVRGAIETHLALLEGLSDDPFEEDPILEGRIASLTRTRGRRRAARAPVELADSLGEPLETDEDGDGTG